MIELYWPQLRDLWFRRDLLRDEDTMSYNRAWGGAIDFPEGKWAGWYDQFLGSGDGRRFYRYLRDTEAGEFVGETAYHYDEERDIFLCDVIVHARFRGRGYGAAGLRLLCDSARANGLTALYDDIAADNPSVALFLKNGFAVEYRTDEIVMVKRVL